MTDSIFANPSPVTPNDFDGSSHAWGMKFTVSEDAICVGGRAWIPAAGRPATFLWQIWRVGDATKIAESNLNAGGHGTPTSGAWYSFSSSLFSTPGDVALSSAQTYRVCVAFDDGDGVYTDNGTETFPTGTGVVSSTTGSFTNDGGTNVMPGTDYLAWFFADVTVETGGDDATATPATIACTTTVPSPTLSTGAAATPGAISVTSTAAAVSVATGSTVSPTAVSAATTVGSPTVSAGSTATPAVIGCTTAVGAPTIATGSTATPAATACTVTIPAPTVSGGATVNPGVLAAATAIGAPTLSAGTTVSPGLITATVTFPAAAVSTGANLATSWQAGPPHGRWHTGLPGGRWRVGLPGGS